MRNRKRVRNSTYAMTGSFGTSADLAGVTGIEMMVRHYINYITVFARSKHLFLYKRRKQSVNCKNQMIEHRVWVKLSVIDDRRT